MEKVQFKTNINCSGCVAKVTPFLNDEKRIGEWSVDTDIPQKVLTLETDGMSEAEVQGLLTKAGFKSEPISLTKNPNEMDHA